MAKKQMMEKLYNATLVTDRIIFLAGAATGDVFPVDLEEFFNEEDDETIEKCLGKIPEWVNLDANGYELAESINSWLNNVDKFGYLVRFTTPVMTPHKGGSRSYSWGYRNSIWLYAETMDDALAQGLAWANEIRAYEDKKAGIEKEVKGKKEETA